MWAQYAANNTGACICIRKDRFIQENQAVLKNRFYKFSSVKYGFGKPTLEYKNEQHIDFITRYWKQIFFYKETDWRQENEYRLFGIDLPECLSLENSIAYICLGAKFHDAVFKGKNPIEKWDGRKCKDILVEILTKPTTNAIVVFGHSLLRKCHFLVDISLKTPTIVLQISFSDLPPLLFYIGSNRQL